MADIKIEGIEDVLSALEELADTSKVESAIQSACALVEREAKQKAPKGNGELRRSIKSEVNGISGVVYTALEYAPYVEYGTGLFAEDNNGRKEVPWVYVEGSSGTHKKTIHTEESADRAVAYLRSKGLEAYKTSGEKPQPFMRPALNENREKILDLLRGAIQAK